MISQHEASSELNRLRQAMEVIGFFKGAQKNIFKLISAILQLGNITFKVVGSYYWNVIIQTVIIFLQTVTI